MKQKKRKLHELPNTEIVKSGTIRLTSVYTYCTYSGLVGIRNLDVVLRLSSHV